MRLGFLTRSDQRTDLATDVADTPDVPSPAHPGADSEKEYRARIEAIRETIDLLEADLSAHVAKEEADRRRDTDRLEGKLDRILELMIRGRR